MTAESTVRVLGTDDLSWDAVVDVGPSDFYHRRAYHALAEESGEGEARLVVVETDGASLAWPYLRRAVPDSSWFDAGCVYGYPGPLLTGVEGRPPFELEALRQQMWRLLLDHWAREEVVTVFTTFDPLIANVDAVRGLSADDGPEPIVTLGRSVSIDLRPTALERRAAYEKETRYEIGRAHRAGLRTRVDRTGDHVGDLARLYDATMRRNAASDRYLYSRDYLERLLAALDGRGRLLVATMEPDGDVVGVLLFVVDGDHAHAHLTGVSQEHLRLAPLNAMLDAAADAARDEGALLLHLGAGRGGTEDSLYRFKRRIGSVEHAFDIGRWVIDAGRYRTLVDTAGVVDDVSFFPAYRGAAAR